MLKLGAAAALLAASPPLQADTVAVHYAPAENLERIDTDLLHGAKSSIDLAAYSLTDPAVIAALVDAKARGLAVRIVLDPSQHHALDRLAPLAGVIRFKQRGPYMHLKAYAIDGLELRTGSANLSRSGLKRQNNDLIVMRDTARTAAFERMFARLWQSAGPRGAELPASTAGAPSLRAAQPAPRGPAGARWRTWAPGHKGATARCRDGMLSFARTHRGACSRHDGVALWYR